MHLEVNMLKLPSQSWPVKVALLAAATPLIAQHVGVWLVIAVRLFQVNQINHSCL